MASKEELPKYLIKRLLDTIKNDPLASGALKSLIVENIIAFSRESLGIELAGNDLDSLEKEMLEKAEKNPLLFIAVTYAVPKSEKMIAGNVGPLTRELFRTQSQALIGDTLKEYIMKVYGGSHLKQLEELKKSSKYDDILRAIVEAIEDLGLVVPGSIEIEKIDEKEIKVHIDPCTFAPLSLKLMQEGITNIFGEHFCAFGSFMGILLGLLGEKTVDFEPIELSPPTCSFKLKIL